MPKEEVYDAIVVGSGATGGWAAKELTEGGMRVIVLEAGRKLDPMKDFTEHAWPYDAMSTDISFSLTTSTTLIQLPIESRSIGYARGRWEAAR
jgi:choline dehydrogenase-like flavoprotein